MGFGQSAMNYNNCWDNIKVLGIDLMDCEPVIISREEYFLFHKIDRELYEFLVINLAREPMESLRVVALWFWLERIGYRNIVKRILSLPKNLINEVADEALLCLNCVMSSSPTVSSFKDIDIPIMRSIANKQISLRMLDENRNLANQGIAKTQEVCLRAVSDIMKQVQIRNLTACTQDMAESKPVLRKPVFTKVEQLRPATSGLTLSVKVVNTKMVKQKKGRPQPRQMRIAECLVGDETGMIVFSAKNDQVDLMKEGSTLILRNAKIDMFKGSMRLAVDKLGRLAVTEPASFTVKEDNNLSLIEFERVDVMV